MPSQIHASGDTASRTRSRNTSASGSTQPASQNRVSRCTTVRFRRLPTARARVDLPLPEFPKITMRCMIEPLLKAGDCKSAKPGKPHFQKRQSLLEDRMPLFARLACQRVPEEFELMSSVIFCKMAPGIRKCLGDMTLIKYPRLPRRL